MVGYSPGELRNMDFRDITPAEWIDGETRFINDVVSVNGYGEFEKEYMRKDGTRFPVLIIAWVIRDITGKPDHYGAIVRDLTESKSAEADRKMLEERLFQAQKMESIGTLAGGIAHDFNNLLVVIIGYAEYLMKYDSSDPDMLREGLEEIFNAGIKARDITRQILAFSRKSEVERGPLRLSLILKETLKFLRSTLPSSIEIRRNITAESDIVMSDVAQIQQVLMNLFSNAAQAMENQKGVLSVSLENIVVDERATETGLTVKPGLYVKLNIGDTGKGIEPGTCKRIFEPYFTTKPKGKGTGIGLAVVHGIVTDHGGAIQVKSEVGKGTDFEILLPVIDAFVEERKLDTGSFPGGTERILFIDDEEQIAVLAKRILTSFGYDVTVETDSEKAFETFRSSRDSFDLVITDQTMPGMTGIELVREIKNNRPDMPVILCTGYSDIVSPEKAGEECIDGFCYKPIIVREFAEMIRRVLDN